MRAEEEAIRAASAINPLFKVFHEEALADLQDAIEERIRSAVLAEREGCAKIAESYEPLSQNCADVIAHEIRERGGP